MYQNGWKLTAMQTFEIPKNPKPIDLPMDACELVGSYTLSDGVEYSVTLEGRRLFGQQSERPRVELHREVGNVYFTKNDARIRWIFVVEDEKVTKMLYRRNGNDLVWEKEGI